MPRYGDFDALSNKLEALAKRYAEKGLIEVSKEYIWACTLVDAAPTADVVEVVRCEKCLHSEANNTGYWCKKACYIADAMVTPQHFCGYGERRNDG